MEDNLKQSIEQMKNGVEKGFNEVYSQTFNRVYFRAKQIMKKEEDAQDLTQIVFVEAYKCIGSLQAPEALYGWLDGITYRQGMKIFRKNKDILLTEEAEGLFDTLENNDLSTIPELSADQKATSEIIKGIIEELPELQKTAVVMFYFDGMKVEQIASAMECSENTIKSRLNYARKFIKNKVEEKEKTEGYRLHTLVPPVFWYAIKVISDNTTLTAQTAQEVYTGACTTVGLQATAITVTTGVGASAGAGASIVSAVVGETAKAVSIGAKLAALSTGIKTVIIAGAVVVTAGVAGTLYAVNHQEETKEEESIAKEALIEDAIVETLVETIEEGSLEDILSSISSDEQDEVVPEGQISEEQIPEETPMVEETVTTEYEEVIGDFDLAPDALTMDGMQELVVGLDIPYLSDENISLTDFYSGDFNLLFPNGLFMTYNSDAISSAKQPAIEISVMLNLIDSMDVGEGAIEENTTIETIGKYTVMKEVFDDNSNGYNSLYFIVNEEGTSLRIDLIIKKISEYQEYCDNLVEEYVPAFHETLLSNFK